MKVNFLQIIEHNSGKLDNESCAESCESLAIEMMKGFVIWKDANYIKHGEDNYYPFPNTDFPFAYESKYRTLGQLIDEYLKQIK